jgi:hypothetical protein
MRIEVPRGPRNTNRHGLRATPKLPTCGRSSLAAVDDASVAMGNRGAGMDDHDDVTGTLDLRPGDKISRDLHPRQ